MRNIFLIVLISFSIPGLSQSFTNIWQFGYLSPKGYLDFSSGAPIADSIVRPMNFRSTEAIMCDNNGQLLFYTNGLYIANAAHDTMLNGNDINPGPFTQLYSPGGLPIFQAAIALPYPGDPLKYILLHETGDWNFIYPQLLYQSVIDMTLDGGLGGVTLKNDTILSRPIELGELTACKHANGRDWWVLAHKHLTNLFYKILITPLGVTSIDSQLVSGPISDYGGQAAFSPDGKWYATFDNLSKLRLYNFDRCSGMLTNFQYFDFVPDTILAGGLSFSPDSKVLYASSVIEIFQFDLTSANIATSQKTVAIYDGFYSPYPPFATDFVWHMLGPDGKIYINSGSSVFDLHVINSPNNLDTLCDVQQHSLHLPCWNNKTLPNHINYLLGADTTSACDTILKTLNKGLFSFNFIAFPNPVVGRLLNIFYRLPEGKEGKMELVDMNAKMVFDYALPMWSTQQKIKLPEIPSGIYVVSIASGNIKQAHRIVVQ